LTRFREEHYATKAHRAVRKASRVQRAGDKVHPPKPDNTASLQAQERESLRRDYFKAKGTKPPKANQRRLAWQDLGFG